MSSYHQIITLLCQVFIVKFRKYKHPIEYTCLYFIEMGKSFQTWITGGSRQYQQRSRKKK